MQEKKRNCIRQSHILQNAYQVRTRLTTSQLTISTSHLAKPELRPTHTPLRQRPKLPPRIPTRRSSSNKHRQNMLETRMRSPGITPFQQSHHGFVPRLDSILLHGLLERRFKLERISLVTRLAATVHQIPQIMHRHTGTNDQHPFLSQRFQRFSEREVAFRRVRIEERDLHDRHLLAQWIFCRIKGHEEGREDAVVEAAGHAFCFDSGGAEGGEDFGGEFGGAGVGVLDFIVVRWEAVVVVDQGLGGGGVYFDRVGGAAALPVGGEDEDCFGADLVGYFVADLLEFGVGWVGVVFEEVGAAWGGC
jgi:hypothetical protein